MAVIAGVGSAARSKHWALAKRIEQAMQQAVLDALAEGVPLTDDDTLRERQLQARDSVLREFGL